MGELFGDDRGEPPNIPNEDGPSLINDEIRKRLKIMKKGKAVGPDEIAVEMLEASAEEGDDLLYRILNEIRTYYPGRFAEILFITLLRKPSSVECKDRRAISITSHVIKLR